MNRRFAGLIAIHGVTSIHHGRQRDFSKFAKPSLMAAAAMLTLVVCLPAKAQETAAVTPINVSRMMDRLSAFALKAGLDALKVNATPAAQAVRDALAVGSLDRHILEWAIALSGLREVPSSEIAGAMRDLSKWPGLNTVLRNYERALWRENPPADDVLAAFANTPPIGPEGAMALARAHIANGNTAAAHDVIAPVWRTSRLEEWMEKSILGEFATVLSADDHLTRMQTMLMNERISSAARVAPLANAAPLLDAWAAVIRGDRKAKTLLAAVPKEQQQLAGFRFASVMQARKVRDWKVAAALLKDAPKDTAGLIDADAWWTQRRLIARALTDANQPKLAYEVASGQAAGEPETIAEAEFQAGWIALRLLKKPEMAKAHFEKIVAVSTGAQSLARGHYWLGRALESAKADARPAYQRAAHFGTVFYGQLAAARLGNTALDIQVPQPSAADRIRFFTREAVSAIQRLEIAGHEARARLIYYSLAEEIDSVGEVSMLAALAKQRGDHFLALKVGKIAAARGLDVGALSHPVGAIPEAADIAGSGKALAYSIARQESEFNTGAVSRVGALGLLQLMPDTAAEMAKRAKLPFDQMRLTTDAGYNATLGAEFLGQQINRFDGSYILTFAGYNAGPSRSIEWMKKYGDPRGKDIDYVVDWIERIPFSETRHYVQRIMENYQVYKAQLGGTVNIERDLRYGRQE